MMNLYGERRWLRRFEKAWVQLEALVNRLTDTPFNPLYHLSTLTVFLLVILTVTGVYLTIFYRPGSDRAFETTAFISASWLGSLMRSIHRYASDGMLIVIGLHALKMLLSDCFWGSRWLAWVSGWLMLLLTWSIGTMGYWMVWDARAQWMTEYLMDTLGGGTALTFVAVDLSSKTFSVFVIILFLHVFMPLGILVGIVVHVMRLVRARWWAPRWLMVSSTLALVLVGLMWPVSNAVPADLTQAVQGVPLDWLYLGFLPVAERLGNPVFLGINTVLLGVLMALPWLSRGRHLGPAVVTTPSCSGCTLCARECPYDAIQVGERSDESRFKKVAAVDPRLCTGCGICVGTCGTAGITLKNLPTPLVIDALLGQVVLEVKSGKKVNVVFTCQRHGALDSLPPGLRLSATGILPPTLQGTDAGQLLSLHSAAGGSDSPAGSLTQRPPVSPMARLDWGQDGSVIAVVLPCVGMVDVDWIKDLHLALADQVVLFGCPSDDCREREGPLWTLARLQRRPAIKEEGLHYLEASPGSPLPLVRLLDQIQAGQPPPIKLPEHRKRNLLRPGVLGWAFGLLLLTLLFSFGVPLEIKTDSSMTTQANLRLAVAAAGMIQQGFDVTGGTPGVSLPEGVTAEQLMGGRRYPLEVRLLVDGEVVLHKTFQPSGLRKEGRIAVLERLPLAPGKHKVEIYFQNDGGELRIGYSEEVDFQPGKVYLIDYNEAEGVFTMR